MCRHCRLQATGDVGTMQRPNLVRFSRGAMRLRVEIEVHDEINSPGETSQQIPIASFPFTAS